MNERALQEIEFNKSRRISCIESSGTAVGLENHDFFRIYNENNEEFAQSKLTVIAKLHFLRRCSCMKIGKIKGMAKLFTKKLEKFIKTEDIFLGHHLLKFLVRQGEFGNR